MHALIFADNKFQKNRLGILRAPGAHRIATLLRNLDIKTYKNIDCVIHLAYLSCDNSCKINAKETWEIGPFSLYYILEEFILYSRGVYKI